MGARPRAREDGRHRERGLPPLSRNAQRVRQGYAAHHNTTEDAILERFRAKIPLGRYSTNEEVSGLVSYLMTDKAASITAQALNVCGGLGNY